MSNKKKQITIPSILAQSSVRGCDFIFLFCPKTDRKAPCPLARKQVFHILEHQRLLADAAKKHRLREQAAPGAENKNTGNAGINRTCTAAPREAA